jgi:hypothetical protein
LQEKEEQERARAARKGGVSEFFVVPWVLFAKILKLSFSHDPVRKGFNHFSFGDVMYLGT